MAIKRALMVMLLIAALSMNVLAATRKKSAAKADEKPEDSAMTQVKIVRFLNNDQADEVVAAKDVKKKRDISDMAQRKLDKIKQLQAMSSDGVISMTVNEYK
jgi:lipopolysaccharide export LptBFGC system permease protein LptF